jgi:signal peptidase I
MPQRKGHGLIELIKTVFYAVLIALVVRTFAYEPFSIPSGSMIPTLLIGDYLFVSKFSYGYSRYSLPLGLPLIPGRLLYSQPERGDVVVFKLPTDNSTDYIKRIVGLPGDRIQVVKGILHINDKPVERRENGEFTVKDAFGNVRRFRRYIEVLPNGREHAIIEDSDQSPFDNTGVYTVPEGHFFAMGDNRDSSRDSRFLNEVGFVPLENLVGRAEFLFFSVDGEVWKVWEWLGSLRFRRLFDAIL